MKYTLLTTLLILLPQAVFAGDTVQSLFNRGTNFIGNILIYFLIAVALISFVFNVSRYFIFGGGDEAGREKAKRFALYSILALVLIVIMWTIINVIVAGLGFGRAEQLRPDYRLGYQSPRPDPLPPPQPAPLPPPPAPLPPPQPGPLPPPQPDPLPPIPKPMPVSTEAGPVGNYSRAIAPLQETIYQETVKIQQLLSKDSSLLTDTDKLNLIRSSSDIYAAINEINMEDRIVDLTAGVSNPDELAAIRKGTNAQVEAFQKYSELISAVLQPGGG